ncbi:MAG: hypothetical protein JO257_13300 [Deltaproteobacteria bacterium]|nr:hypothetical protein [Deltaproteobacteria bacterium]
MRARLSAIAIGLALASCSGASETGGTCSATALNCGAGAICDLTDPAGPTCISATGDIDGDGIPNGKDFCEHQAGGAHDEDNDGIGDECDPCPIAKPPASPDRDGDAVDSPCDPDPDTAGDEILLFNGFNDALGSAWTPTTPGAWTVQGGELVVTNIPTQEYLRTNVAEAPNMAIEASYRIDKLETTATTHLVAVHAHDPRPAGVASLECGVVHADSGTGDVVDLETNQNTATTRALGSAFNSASLYQAAAYASGNNVGCTVLGDGHALGAVQAPVTADAEPSVALTARAVTARFQWILVVGR